MYVHLYYQLSDSIRCRPVQALCILTDSEFICVRALLCLKDFDSLVSFFLSGSQAISASFITEFLCSEARDYRHSFQG